jgi:hypothetical protein
MSVYMTFSEDAGEQIASNQGWADFCKWARDSGNFDMLQLADEGYTRVAGLAESLRERRAPDADTQHVVDGVLKLLDENRDAEAVFVTTGMRR